MADAETFTPEQVERFAAEGYLGHVDLLRPGEVERLRDAFAHCLEPSRSVALTYKRRAQLNRIGRCPIVDPGSGSIGPRRNSKEGKNPGQDSEFS